MRPYLSGNPSPWFTVISSSKAYVNDVRKTGFSGDVLFGAETVCFSTNEMSETEDICLRDEIWSDKYVAPYSRSSDSYYCFRKSIKSGLSACMKSGIWLPRIFEILTFLSNICYLVYFLLLMKLDGGL